MGINSTETSYNFGQLGSAYLLTKANTLTPPDGMVIIAIQCLATTEFDVLTPETTKAGLTYSGTNSTKTYFGIGSNANVAGNSQVITTDTQFPKGFTITGRYTAVSINNQTNNMGVICYFGK